MSKPTKCPNCGTALSSTQLDGLCPECIAKVTLELKRPEKANQSQQAKTRVLTPGDNVDQPTSGNQLKRHSQRRATRRDRKRKWHRGSG